MKEKIETIMVRIWGIRDAITELEHVKDAIIEFWNEVAGSDDSYNMWISDLKEMYYSITSAWTMLKGSVKKEEYVTTSRKYLTMARSRMEQVASELQTQKNEESSALEAKLREVFDICLKQINTELKELKPESKDTPTDKKVVKKDANTYVLPCSVCGNYCIVFLLRPSPKTKKQTLYYSGILVETTFTHAGARKIFQWLDEENLKKVHKYLKRDIQTEEGMDGYCPECDKVYCEDHYHTWEIFDDGFYDCTKAECPQNHVRIIHD